MTELVQSIAAHAITTDRRKVYTDLDGVKRCAICGDPVSMFSVELDMEVPVTCSCYQREQEEEKRLGAIRAAKDKYKNSPIYNAGYIVHTFDKDMAPASTAGTLCRKYVERWDDMKAGNMGLLLIGPPGTGKTFYAGCVMTALHEKGVTAAMVGASELASIVTDRNTGRGVLSDLSGFDALVIDDLGAESDYATNTLFRVLDGRYLTRKPLIITTNNGMDEMKAWTGNRARMYDRINEMCTVVVVLSGESKRTARAEDKRRRAADLLK